MNHSDSHSSFHQSAVEVNPRGAAMPSYPAISQWIESASPSYSGLSTEPTHLAPSLAPSEYLVQEISLLRQRVAYLEADNYQLRQAQANQAPALPSEDYPAAAAAPSPDALSQAIRQYYAPILDALPIAVCLVQGEGTILYANRAAHHLFAKLAPDLVNTPLRYHIVEADQPKFNHLLQSSDLVRRAELRIQSIEGKPSWTEGFMQRVQVFDTELVLSAFFDITPLKQAEMAARKGWDDLQVIADALPGGVAYVGRDRRYRFVNSTYEQWLNCRKSDIVGQTLWDVLGESAYQSCKTYVERVLTGQLTRFATRMNLSCGITRDIEGYLVPDFDEFGQQHGYYALVTDVTKRKEIEQELRRARSEYHNIFSRALTGIFQLTATGQYICVNPAMANLHGYAHPDEMLNAIAHEAQQLYVDSFKWTEFQEKLAVTDEIESFEYQARRADGQTIWLQVNVRAIREEHGELRYYEGVVDNIEQRKQVEAALKRKVYQLRIDIDQEQRSREVSGIANSDYFQSLKQDLPKLRHQHSS